MRPVVRGNSPVPVYVRYQDAKPHLVASMGDYCSFCERKIETHLAVEHIQPKVHVPQLELHWQNFLLACVHCNSCKGDTPINVPEYFWPDQDNTLRGIDYSTGGLVQADAGLLPPLKAKAQATITLLGLDKHPGNVGNKPKRSDKRWLRRQEVWQEANKERQDLAGNDSPKIRELIVKLAVAKGMFSIWWTVFQNDFDMKQRLRAAFIGTDSSSFDPNENLVPRPGGQI